MAKQRNTARETEAVDKKFRILFNPLTPVIEELVFDIITGKIIIPVRVDRLVFSINTQWNYAATIFNKKLRGATANFGAIKTKFNKDVSAREMKLFINTVAKIFEDKFGLKLDKIDVEFILKYKSEGLNPEQVCNVRALEIEPDKVTWFKHKHEWTIVSTGTVGFVIICRDCRYQYEKRYLIASDAVWVANKLPKTKFGLRINHFKNYYN